MPLAPGHGERREVEAIRTGTGSFLLTWEVVTGQIVAPAGSPTRTDAHFLAHLQQMIAPDPPPTCWHWVVDNRTTHCSESLMHGVAAASGLMELGLGEQGKRGILASLPTGQPA